MKSIGDTLKKAREEKAYSIEDIARETNIAKKYIIALEMEDFSMFPAEAYILGFLKNYGEFLGLDVKDLHNQYRVLKIQDQPVPINELLETKRGPSRAVIPLSIALVIILFITGAVFLVVNIYNTPRKNRRETRVPVQYELKENFLEKRFYKDDSVIVSSGGDQYKIALSNIGDMVTLSTPQGDVSLNLNTDIKIDMNDGGALSVSTSDYTENNPEAGALLRFEINGALAGTESREPDTPQTGTGNQKPEGAAAVIWTASNPYPFTLEVSFQGYCMFRWEILRETGRQSRNEKYCSRGEELSIQAQNGVRLWISNTGALRMQAIGGGHNIPVTLGDPGEIVVSDILWRREGNGRYALVKAKLEN